MTTPEYTYKKSNQSNEYFAEYIDVLLIAMFERHVVNEAQQGLWHEYVKVMMNTRPFGNPASSAKAAKAKAVKGVSSAGFRTMVHPAANAAPAYSLNNTFNSLKVSFKVIKNYVAF